MTQTTSLPPGEGHWRNISITLIDPSDGISTLWPSLSSLEEKMSVDHAAALKFSSTVMSHSARSHSGT